MDWNVIFSAILGAVVGGFFTLVGGAYQVRSSEKIQEKDNKNKLKIGVLIDIMGNRTALSDSQNSSMFAKTFFNAMNRITVTFNDNKTVIELYDEFSRHAALPPEERNVNTSNEIMYKLIKSMYKDLNMEPPTFETFMTTLY